MNLKLFLVFIFEKCPPTLYFLRTFITLLSPASLSIAILVLLSSSLSLFVPMFSLHYNILR